LPERSINQMSSDLPDALALAASSDDRMREVSLGDTGAVRI